MPTLSRFLGRNGQKSPTEITDQECVKCQNLFLSGHSLLLRGGYTQAFQDTLDTTDPVWGLHRSYLVDGAPFWMWTVGSTLRSLRTGSQVTLKTLSAANKGVGFIEANNKIYVLTANTTDKIQKTDGTLGGTADHPSANAPFASIGLYMNKRMIVNDLNNFSRIWLSDTNDPDTFRNQSSSAILTEGGYIDVSLGDGDRVKGFGRLGSALFIFKERSIHMLVGTSFTGDETFRLLELFRGIGTKSPRSIVTVENGILFLDSDGKVRYFYSPARQLYSELGRPMEDYTTAIPTAGLQEAAAFYFNRRYFVSFWGASASRNNTTFALDIRIVAPLLGFWVDTEVPSAWTEITGNAWNIGVVTNGQSDTAAPYYADATPNGKVWQFLTGTTDNGVAIPYALRSKAYGADAPSTIKAVSEVGASLRTFTTAVTHEVYTDLATSTAAAKALTPASAVYDQTTWRPNETARGSVLQVGLSGSSSVGGEILALDWDWAPKRKQPVDA